MGVKAFNREERDLTTTQIIEDTLEFNADGSVSFRARRGKGSGKPVEIAGDQFDKFVSIMNDIASRRETLAVTASETDTEDNTSTDETTEVAE